MPFEQVADSSNVQYEVLSQRQEYATNYNAEMCGNV